jgi:hypothetical protein
MYAVVSETRVNQGDIFRDLEFQYINEDQSTDSVTFPFWIVLTQDCDLEHDFNATSGKHATQDKKLQTILVCPAFVGEQLRAGTHMQQLSWTMQTWNSDLWKPIKNNKDYRFHLLPADKEAALPELVVDFKRFFTLPRDYVYSNTDKRVIAIDVLYKEALSQRFAYYLSRVALPEESLDS